ATVTDVNGCTATSNVTIPLGNGTTCDFTITPTVVQPSCGQKADGSIVLTIGGNSNLTYEWNTGSSAKDVNPASAKIYSVLVQSATCKESLSFDVKAVASVCPGGVCSTTATLSLSQTTAASCPTKCDGQITATVTGITPTKYVWGGTETTVPTFSAACGKTYTVQAIDANKCFVEKTITVGTENPDCNVVVGGDCPFSATYSFTATSSVDACDGSITIQTSNTSGTPTYAWNPATLGSAASVSGLCQGYYNVAVSDASNCTVVVNVYLPAGNSCNPNVVVVKKDVSCNGLNDGEINVAAQNMGVLTSCYSQIPVPQQSCAVCDQYLEGTYNGTLSANLKYCVKAGKTLTGNITLAAGKLIVCGAVSNLNLTVSNTAELHLNGTAQFSNLNLGSTAKLFNYGYANLPATTYYGNVTNYAKIKVNGTLVTAQSSVWVNRGELEVTGFTDMNGTLNNEGLFKAGSLMVRSPLSVLSNSCTINVGGDLTNNGTVNNNGKIVNGGSAQMSFGANENLGNASYWEAGDFKLYGAVTANAGNTFAAVAFLFKWKNNC
ncbi:MAG: hypothetical protein NT150_07590, partial [Bacteroidetes bacterium]|nr:hypothetical protein [Bacteroidota bacterium]